MSSPHLNNHKDYILSISIGVFASVLPILFGIMHITRNALLPMKFDALGLSIMLCGVFVFFPEIFKKNKLTAFLVIVIVLPIIGISFYSIPFFLETFLILLFFGAIVFNIKKWKSISFSFLIFSFLISFFLILLIYSSSAQILSPVYNELIINGKAVPDTLFHAAVSNSIVNEQTVSTRVFGSSSFPYHWFSHFVFGGLAKFAHVGSITFYNWVYPVFIIPVFVKYLFIFYQHILNYFNLIKEKYLLAFFPALLLYFFIFLGIGGFPSYLSSESLILAHIFQFIFWSLVLKYHSKIMSDKPLLLILFIVLLILLFTKVSVGLLTFIPAVYLYIRNLKNKSGFIAVILSGLIFFCICYFYFLNIRVKHETVGMLTKLFNFNKSVISFFSYAVSLFFVIGYLVSQQNSLSNIKNDFVAKKTLFVELIALSIILSFVMGIYFGSRQDDSLYFASTFYFINFIILMLFFIQNFKISTNSKRLKWVGFSLIILCFMMTPGFSMIKYNSFNEKRIASQKDHRMAQLITALSHQNYPKNSVISISRNEKWFWNSQQNKITPYFIISGITNSASLLQITEEDLSSNHYSFPAYKNTYSDIETTKKLSEKALSMGYSELIYFETINNKLVEKKINLK